MPSGTAARTLPRMCAHPCAPYPSCSRVFSDSCIADRWYRICYGLGFRYSVFKVQTNFMCSGQIKDLSNGDGGIRTLDPLLARQVLSQLSYIPNFKVFRRPPALPCLAA